MQISISNPIAFKWISFTWVSAGNCVLLSRQPVISLPPTRSSISFPKPWVTSHVAPLAEFLGRGWAGVNMQLFRRPLLGCEQQKGHLAPSPHLCTLYSCWGSTPRSFFNLWLPNLACPKQSSLKLDSPPWFPPRPGRICKLNIFISFCRQYGA